MNGTVLKEMLGRIAERGRAIMERRPARVTSASATPERIEDLCRALLSGRGEASGVALGGKVLDLYAALSIEQKVSFFRILARSEERRVGKECRLRWSPCGVKKRGGTRDGVSAV